MAVESACNPFRPAIREKVLTGSEYAHYFRFPKAFAPPDALHDQVSLDHLSVRTAASSPDLLVVAGCGYVDLGEQCSANGFLVDTERGYTVTSAKPNDWEQAIPLPGSDSLTNPTGHRLPLNTAPLGLQVSQAGVSQGEPTGWSFDGNSYYRRGDWIKVVNIQGSADGKLVVLVGADKRTLPPREFLLAIHWAAVLTEPNPGHVP